MARAHVMKLNYTSLQHAVEPVEEGLERLERPLADAGRRAGAPRPARRCAAFALAERAPGTRVGYVQTAGGALPGALSDMVAELLERGLLADHVTAGAVLRRAARGDHGRGRARRRRAAASAGTARSSGRAPGSSARPRRSATAGLRAVERARGAVARLPGGARAAAVERRPAASATAGLSHHTRDRAGAAAAAGARWRFPTACPCRRAQALERRSRAARHERRRGRRRGAARRLSGERAAGDHDGPLVDEDRDFFLAGAGRRSGARRANRKEVRDELRADRRARRSGRATSAP